MASTNANNTEPERLTRFELIAELLSDGGWRGVREVFVASFAFIPPGLKVGLNYNHSGIAIGTEPSLFGGRLLKILNYVSGTPKEKHSVLKVVEFSPQAPVLPYPNNNHSSRKRKEPFVPVNSKLKNIHSNSFLVVLGGLGQGCNPGRAIFSTGQTRMEQAV